MEVKETAMAQSRPDLGGSAASAGQNPAMPGRHSLREQDALWAEFLSLAATVVDSLDKSTQALCEGQFDLISDVEHEEEDSDRREVLIEQECLRMLARYEPVASDLRRMATILKVNRDWERIADLALRIARRARKLSRDSSGVAMPDALKTLARDVLNQVRLCYEALAGRDAAAARGVIAGDNVIDAQYRTLRKQFKDNLSHHPEQMDAWLLLINTARNLERLADHATGIAQTIVYLQEGIIIRHETHQSPAP
jgi:phosphate transport system protein